MSDHQIKKEDTKALRYTHGVKSQGKVLRKEDICIEPRYTH
jgi:hypothetical protein